MTWLSATETMDAVVLVADAGLGTINAVRLSMDALTSATMGTTAARHIPVLVVLDRFEPKAVALVRRHARKDLLLQPIPRVKAALVKHLGRERANGRMEPPGLLKEQSAIGRDGRVLS